VIVEKIVFNSHRQSRWLMNGVIIVTSGIIPPVFRRFCDDATALIRQTAKDSLKATTVGDLYAGDIEHRGVDHYLDRAFNLGRKLV